VTRSKSCRPLNVPNNENGSLLLVLSFVVFLTFIGFSLAFSTISHTRITGERAFKLQVTENLKEDVIYYLHNFRRRIFEEKLNRCANPVVEYFNSVQFPQQEINGRSVVSPSFNYVETLYVHYKKFRVTGQFGTRTIATGAAACYLVRADVSLELLSGGVPVSEVPFFLEKQVNGPQFLEDNRITSAGNLAMTVGEEETDLDFAGCIADALEIPRRILLQWREIRLKLGMPQSDQPLPEGIYCFQGSGVVPAVFIQGDLEQMIFFVVPDTDGQVQGIRFTLAGGSYEIQYRPGAVDFQCTDQAVAQQSLFKETLIVNGRILSLVQQGDAAFTASARILLLVSGRTVIRSDLLRETNHIGLDTVKVTALTLVTGMEQLFGISYEDDPPGITVDTGVTGRVEATLITSGDLSVQSDQLEVRGSVYAKDYKSGGSLKVRREASGRAHGEYFKTVDYNYLRRFLLYAVEEVEGE